MFYSFGDVPNVSVILVCLFVLKGELIASSVILMRFLLQILLIKLVLFFPFSRTVKIFFPSRDLDIRIFWKAPFTPSHTQTHSYPKLSFPLDLCLHITSLEWLSLIILSKWNSSPLFSPASFLYNIYYNLIHVIKNLGTVQLSMFLCFPLSNNKLYVGKDHFYFV